MSINIEYGTWGLILLGCLYSLYLVSLIPQGVFFNGDGALKALLAKQLSQGQLRFDLVEKVAPWIQRLWEEGLYAYQPPFVYDLNQRHYVSFPFPFPWLTSFFYKLFDYRGFYVIPLLSTWVLWVTFYGISSLLYLESWQTFVGLLFLIFASPLTLYSSMYWEHTLAVALSFLGITLAFFIPENMQLGLAQALLGGCLVGLSVWFRSECLALIAALTFLIMLGLTPQQDFIGKQLLEQHNFNISNFLLDNINALIFVAGMSLSVLLFWLCNKIIYNRFLGIHALLILEEFSWSKRFKEALKSFQQLNGLLVEYLPFSIIPLSYLLILGLQKVSVFKDSNQLIIVAVVGILSLVKIWAKVTKNNIRTIDLLLILASSYLFSQVQLPATERMIFIYALYFTYTVGVSCLVDFAPGEATVGGKQWGPRYLLPLTPLIAGLVVEQIQVLLEQSEQPLVNYGGLALLLAILLLGIYKNLYGGTQYFYKTHQGIAEAVEVIKKNPNKVVAFSHQYAAQSLGFSLKDTKTFFTVKTSQDLRQLCQSLIEQGIGQFLYVCYPYQSCEILEEDTSVIKLEKDATEREIKLNRLGVYGKYPIYNVVIAPPGNNLDQTEEVAQELNLACGELACTILPTYNERDNIKPLIEQLLAAVPSPYLILVVDDNSPDETWKIVEDIAQQYSLAPTDPEFKYGVVLQRRINEKGLTSAIQRGIDEAINLYGAKIVTWMDCDLSMPPEDVPRLIRSVQENNADVAVGSRWVSGGDDVAHGMMARLLSWIINRTAVIMLGDAVHDYTSGFIAARSEVLQRIRLRGDYGEYCIDLLGRASRLGYKLVEVPYLCVPRLTGESKTGINLWDYLDKGRNYVATIWRLRWYSGD